MKRFLSVLTLFACTLIFTQDAFSSNCCCPMDTEVSYDQNSDGPYLIEFEAIPDTPQDEDGPFEWYLHSAPYELPEGSSLIAAVNSNYLEYEVPVPGFYRFEVSVDLEQTEPPDGPEEPSNDDECQIAQKGFTLEVYNQNNLPVVDAWASEIVCAGFELDFDTQALGDDTEWTWDFGDGNGSDLEDPNHIYEEPGVYFPTVIVCNDIGCAEIFELPAVTVLDIYEADCLNAADCHADVEYNEEAPNYYVFHNDWEEGPESMQYAWNFGDGSPEVYSQDAFRFFSDAGSYHVCLTISSPEDACLDTHCRYIYVEEPAASSLDCLSEFEASASGNGNFTVELAVASDIQDGYLFFDFGDESGNVEYLADEEIVEYTYELAGDYEICMTTMGVNGCIVQYCETVEMGQIYCNASLVPELTENLGELDLENNSAGWNLSYFIDYGDGYSDDLGAEFISEVHQYNENGNYEVCLTVTSEDDCADTDCHTIVIDGFPENECTVQLNILDLVANTVTFEAITSGGINSFVMDYGDGNEVENEDLEFLGNHLYEYNQSYVACLTVNGEGDCNAQDCIEFTIEHACQSGFQINDISDLEIVIGNAIIDGEILDIDYGVLLIDYGNGVLEEVSASDFPFSYQYDSEGTYDVCLTMSDDADCSDTYCEEVIVEDPPYCDASVFLELTDIHSEISLDNYSEGENLSYTIDFGDGVVQELGTDFNITNYQFAEVGPYNVCLTVVSDDGCSDTDCDTIEIPPLPECNADFEWTEGDLFGHFTITNASTGSNLDYVLDFGEGEPIDLGTEFPPIHHQYAMSGTYAICLNITSDDGCTDAICQNITVQPNDCNVELSYEIFESLAVFSSEISGEASSFFMDYGDGLTEEGELPYVGDWNYSYEEGIVTTACLTIFGADGCEETSCVDINTTYCLASFTAEGDGLEIALNNNSIVSGPTSNFLLDLGDGTVLEFEDSFDFPANYEYEQSGTYNVCLTVSADDACSDELCQEVIVEEIVNDCEAELSVELFDDGSVQFSADISGDVSTYLMDYGNGTLVELDYIEFLEMPYSYASGETYIACLTVLGENGCMAESCIEVVIPQSFCQAGFELVNIEPSMIVLSNSSIGNALNFNFDFGDDTVTDFASSDFPINHEYASAGTYEICLTITADDGCTDLLCQSVTIAELLPETVEICGTVTVSTTEVDQVASGSVYLIEISDDDIYNVVEVAPWGSGDGSYCFILNASSQYLIKADVSQNSPSLELNLPTYLGNELSWEDATVIDPLNLDGLDTEIALANPADVTAGQGSVSGLVESSIGKVGEEIGEICIYLLDLIGNPVIYSFVNDDGEYSLMGLAPGQYWLHADVLGSTSTPVLISISEYELAWTTNFSYGLEEVVIENSNATTGIEDSIEQDFACYPNPVTDVLHISLEGNWRVDLMNLQGQTVSSSEYNSHNGAFQIPFNNLPAGTYLLHLTQGEKQAAVRIMKN